MSIMNNYMTYEGFKKLLEADEKGIKETPSYQIISTFYSVYAILISIASDYDKIVEDLKKIASSENITEKDPTGKVRSMEEMIESVVSFIKDPYKEIAQELKEVSDHVIESYKKFLGKLDKEDEEEIRKTSNLISKSAVEFISNLKETKKEIRENLNISESIYDDILFEALHRKERNEIIRSIIATKASVINNIETGGFGGLENTFNSYISILDDIANKVDMENEKYWKEKKRKDRLKEIEDMRNKIIQIPIDMENAIFKYARRLGADSESIKELGIGIEKLEKVKDKLKKIQKDELIKQDKETETNKKEEEKEKVSNKREYKDISPNDIENMRKDGKNREQIKEYQSKVNKILEKDNDYRKIAEDGLYGEKTKKAFSEVQKMLNKFDAKLNIRGVLSAETQRKIDLFMENKEKIEDLLKNN